MNTQINPVAVVGTVNPDNHATVGRRQLGSMNIEQNLNKSESRQDMIKRMKKSCFEFNNKVIKTTKLS